MSGIIQIGKRRWLAGMSWLSYESSPSKSDLREDAERQRAAWVSIRNATDYKQAGFCAPIEGEKTRNLFSLAAKLAESKQQPWLGVFRIDDQLSWYIAVRDNHTILPDGDVLGGPDEIRAARERHSGFLDWNHVEGDLAALTEMLDAVDEKSSPVKPIDGVSTTPQIAIAATVGVSLLVGAGWWYSHKQQEERERQAAMAAMRMRLAQQAAAPKIAAPAAAPSSAPAIPAPDIWLHACGNAVLDLPLSQYGWALDKVTCNQASAVVTWKRSDGATLDQHPDGTVSPDGEVVTQALPLPKLDALPMEALLSRQEASERFRAWTQSSNLKLTFTPPPSAPPALPGADKQQAPAPAFTQAAFSLSTAVTPFASEFEQALAALPGMRISGIELTDAGWTLQGVLYAR